MNLSLFFPGHPMNTQIKDIPQKESQSLMEADRPWNVIVLNDPVNLMSYVTFVFQRVFGFSQAVAEKHMLEVHENGKSIVWTGNREKAEFYIQQLHTHLLLAVMEQCP